MKKSLFFFILGILSVGLISPTLAVSVVYENNSLIVSGVPDDGIGLGAFDIVLLYPEDVQVSGITLTPPFVGAVNDQQEGRVVLAGFQVSDVLTGDIPVASLTVTGDSDALDIRVRSLLNQRSEEIPRTNAGYSEPVSPSDDGPDDSGDSSSSSNSGSSDWSSDVHAHVTAGGAVQVPETGSSETSSEGKDDETGTDVAIDSGLNEGNVSDETIASKSENSDTRASNPAKETNAQKSPLSCLGIFISIGVVVLICRKYNHI